MRITIVAEISEADLDYIVTYDADEVGSGFSFSDGQGYNVALKVDSVTDGTGKPIDRSFSAKRFSADDCAAQGHRPEDHIDPSEVNHGTRLVCHECANPGTKDNPLVIRARYYYHISC